MLGFIFVLFLIGGMYFFIQMLDAGGPKFTLVVLGILIIIKILNETGIAF
jgi:hypothetical protein